MIAAAGVAVAAAVVQPAPPPAHGASGEPAAAVHVGFAPPTDRPVIEDTVQSRTIAGAPARFLSRRHYRFVRIAGGWRVAMTVIAIHADAPATAAAAFERAARPMIGVPVLIRLTEDGQVAAVEDGAAHWAAFREGQLAARADMARRATRGDMDRRAIDAVVDAILAADAAARDARLAQDVAALTAFAGRTVAPGAGAAFDADRAGGAAGTLRLVRADEGEASFLLEARTAPGALADIRTVERIDVDRATGLAVRRVRERTTGTGLSAAVQHEERTILRDVGDEATAWPRYPDTARQTRPAP